jgi:hypothetical protein
MSPILFTQPLGLAIAVVCPKSDLNIEMTKSSAGSRVSRKRFIIHALAHTTILISGQQVINQTAQFELHPTA